MLTQRRHAGSRVRVYGAGIHVRMYGAGIHVRVHGAGIHVSVRVGAGIHVRVSVRVHGHGGPRQVRLFRSTASNLGQDYVLLKWQTAHVWLAGDK